MLRPGDLTRLGDRAPIASYGGGGFRIGQTRHDGSILILAGGVYAWPSPDIETGCAAIIERIRAREPADFFLLGTGATQIFPTAAVREAFELAGLGIEPMATSSACRTYNILLAEQRHFAAGLIAI
ncbi:MAG: Mth938-like domain-containing protein [Chitinophagales bacterium]|nr:Mth938-like domain-containing protein [Hyphomicrobiales bacterium]